MAITNTYDLRIKGIDPLISPAVLSYYLPMTEKAAQVVADSRNTAEAILKGELDRIGDILDFGWKFKKQTASGVTSPVIDEIYEAALRAGATGGKISGAGGGGFMMFYCPGVSRYAVIDVLKSFGGDTHDVEFVKLGVTSWNSK